MGEGTAYRCDPSPEELSVTLGIYVIVTNQGAPGSEQVESRDTEEARDTLEKAPTPWGNLGSGAPLGGWGVGQRLSWPLAMV